MADLKVGHYKLPASEGGRYKECGDYDYL